MPASDPPNSSPREETQRERWTARAALWRERPPRRTATAQDHSLNPGGLAAQLGLAGFRAEERREGGAMATVVLAAGVR